MQKIKQRKTTKIEGQPKRNQAKMGGEREKSTPEDTTKQTKHGHDSQKQLKPNWTTSAYAHSKARGVSCPAGHSTFTQPS